LTESGPISERTTRHFDLLLLLLLLLLLHLFKQIKSK
jgi:hypothetical protein